jgi:hypothetical protein
MSEREQQLEKAHTRLDSANEALSRKPGDADLVAEVNAACQELDKIDIIWRERTDNKLSSVQRYLDAMAKIQAHAQDLIHIAGTEICEVRSGDFDLKSVEKALNSSRANEMWIEQIENLAQDMERTVERMEDVALELEALGDDF